MKLLRLLLLLLVTANASYGQTWYRDYDGDDFGSSVSLNSAIQPSGYVFNNYDCNDSNYNVGVMTNLGSAAFTPDRADFGDIAIDNNDVPYVAFKDFNASSDVTVMKYNGSSWVTVGSAGISGGSVSFTNIAFYGSTPYIAYRQTTGGKAAVKMFNGSSWVTVGTAGFSAGSADWIDLAIDGSGTVYVAYKDGGNSSKVTVMKYNGSSWVTVGSAGFSTNSADFVDIAINSSGTPYVAFKDLTTGRANVMRYNGSSWVTVGSANFSAGTADGTEMAIDPSGNLYVIYVDNANSSKATVMKYNGSSWAALGSAGFSNGTTYEPLDIVVNKFGTPYAVYRDGSYSEQGVVMKYNGTSWVNVGTPGFAATKAYYPNIDIDSKGRIYTAFKEGTTTTKMSVLVHSYGSAAAPTTPTLSATSTTICSGTSVNLSINTGSLNDATNWKWYSGSCGGTSAGTGTNISVSPTSTTTYYARGEGSCLGTPGSCGSITITVNTPANITSNPTNSSISSGNNTSFSISASNTTTYSWQVSTNSGSTWSNVANGGIYSNATTATLNLTAATTGQNGYQYRAIANNAGSCPDTSTVAILTVGSGTPPSITTQPPATDTICVGSTKTYSIIAANANSYQWQVSTNGGVSWSNLSNTAPYSNVTTANLTITAATSSLNNYRYRCIATGAASPAATSNTLTLAVLTLPTVNTTVGATVCNGQSAQLNATASSGATIRWYDAATAGNLLGTGNTYTINPATTSANYYAGAVKTYGSAGTNLATPYNTNNGQRGAMFDVQTGTSAITVTHFDCNLYSGTTANYEIWYRASTHVGFENSSAGWIQLGTATALTSAGNNVPTTIPIYFSVTIPANTRYSFYITNDFGGGTSYTDGTAVGNVLASNSDVTIYEGVGKSYPFALTLTTRNINATMHYSAGGSCISTSRTLTPLTVNAQSNITVNPTNSSITSGNNTSFSITATNATSYQWQLSNNSGSTWSNVANTGIYSGATTNTLTLTGATSAVHNYQYRCITSNSGNCADTSTGAILTITGTAPTITTQPTNRTICESTNTTFTVAASGTSLSYQWQVSTNGGSTWNNVSNTGIYSGATTTTLTLTSVPTSADNNRYRCIVTGSVSPAATSNAATLTVNAAPSITTQPIDVLNCSLGASGVFTVTANNASTYQWAFNTGGSYTNITPGLNYFGTTFSGENTSSLTITPGAPMIFGQSFACIISNSCGSVTTNDVVFDYAPPPAINTNPSNSAICPGSNTTFTVLATGANLTYQWQVDNGGGWTNVTNAGIYSGATTNTLTLTGATSIVNTYQYRCVVSGTCTPSATSNAATLTINTAPAITAHPTNSTIGAGSNTSFSVSATGTGLTYQWQVNNGGGWTNVTNTGIYSGATTNTLTLTAATASFNTYQYRCVVSGTCTPAATSNAATLTVNSAPAITAQPVNSAICDGANTTFSVTATNAISYQWQVNNGGGWTNVTNTGIYSGATTSTLTLTGATSTNNGYQYRCEVTGATTPNAISNAATLTINVAPTITSQPVNSIVCSGSSTTFTVGATGPGLTYQWQINNGGGWVNLAPSGIYSGITSSTLAISAATLPLNTYQYRCIVSGTCSPSVTTNAAMLTVNTAPNISAQTIGRTICSGNNTTFTVTATGTTLAYQWQVNNGGGWSNLSNTGIYSGATSNTLALTAATSAVNTYQYRCVVSGTCSPAFTSTAATLTINEAPAITLQPINTSTCDGSNASFGITATGAGLTYQWQVNNGGGWANLTNTGIYTGATTNTLNLTGATSAVNTYQYRCVVTGTCTPATTSNAATLSINSLLTITTHPGNSTICSGNNTSFSVTAAGTGLTYQWQVNNGSGWTNLTNTGIYSGATTNVLNLTAATSANNSYQYRCIISSSCAAPTNSNAATLTINEAPAMTAQPTNSVICTNSNTSFTVTATGAGLNYQWEVNDGSSWSNVTNTGIYSGATTSTLTLTAATSSVNTYQYRCVVSGTCTPSVTSNAATLTINQPPVVTVHPANTSTCDGSNATFTVIASGAGLTYQWQVDNGGGWINLTNTGIYSGATSNTLNLTGATSAVNNYQYRCIVSGTCAPAATSNAATLSINSLLTINTQPASTAICSGNNTTFTVAASGAGLTYQWQEDNGGGWTNLTNTGIYSGATTNTLTLTAATTAVNTYQYRCVVNSTCTAPTNSNAATLTVNVSPAITASPVNSTICEGSNTSFSVTATGTGLSYQWQVDNGGGWTNLTNTGIYSGATTNTLNLTAASTAVNTYQYRCVVSGTCTPGATSAVATLTVNSLPLITGQPSNSTICAGSSTSFSITATGTNATYQWQVNNGGGWANVANTGIYSGATTNTLNLTAATTAVNTYQYRCIVSGTCTPSVTSNAVTITVNAAPAITAQPTNSTVCEQSNTSFSVTATGTALTYQWQVNDGNGWVNVTNTGIYSGAITNTLNLTAVTTAVTGYQYRCAIGGSCTPAINSAVVTITVNTLPDITTQPVNSTICSGNNTTFSIAATGTSITYQWQVFNGTSWSNVANTGIYSGVTTNTLTLTAATTAVNSYLYRCVVSGACTPASTSNAATLTINTAPAITAQATNRIVCENTNTTFTVAATGTALTWQWQVNDGNGWTNLSNTGIYSGTTTSTLSLIGVNTTIDGYLYRCNISGTCTPAATSNSASISILTAPVVTLDPTNDTACAGSNASFSTTATGSALNWQWQVSTNGGGIWNNLANTGVYSNATTSTLNITGATAGMNNYVYRCVINGTCTPAVTSANASLVINTLPSITQQPTNKIVCTGSGTIFSITATGAGLTYQWQGSMNNTTWTNLTNTSYYTGATSSSLVLTGVNGGVFAYYRCIVTGTCAPPAISNSASIEVRLLPVITLQPTDKQICEGQNTSFSIGAGGSAIIYQWQESSNGGTTWTNIINGGVYGGANTFNLTITNAPVSMNNNKYRCNIIGACLPSLTSTTVDLTVNSPVVVTANPVASTTLCSGSSTSFSVGATGTGLTYQWYQSNGNNWIAMTNGGSYSGTNTPTLNINNISVSGSTKSFIYYCVITGVCNLKTSTVCTLNVHALPEITTQPVDITRCHSYGNINFEVVAGGTNISYQWQISTNGGTTWANLANTSIYSGVTTSILSISTATNPMNGYKYKCVINGTCSPAVTSNVVTLTVLPLVQPDVVIATPSNDICAGQSITFTPTPTDGGTAPVYEWRINSSLVTTGNTFTTTSLGQGDIVTCRMTSNKQCAVPAQVISNPITMTVTPYSTASVNISSIVGNSWCSGKPITFNAAPTNGGANPSYRWFINNQPAGTNAPSLPLSSMTNGDVVKCEMTSSLKCYTPDPAVSNIITMTINPTTYSSIQIVANPDTVICDQTEVTMYAAFTNGGTNPKFQWLVNGTDLPGETNGTLKTTGIADGDVVTCRFSSSNTCVFPEISNPVPFKVKGILNPSVSVQTTYNGNNSYTFTAVPVNGGANPYYQWYINMKMIKGENGPTLTSTVLNRWEKIWVEMASSEQCVNPAMRLVQSDMLTTGISTTNAFSEFSLYPNPNNGRFTVSATLLSSADKTATLTIMNALGQVIFREEVPVQNGAINYTLDMNNSVAHGNYILNLDYGDNKASRQFTIME